MSQREFEYKALPKEAVPLARRYRSVIEKMAADIDVVQLEAQASVEAIQANAFKELQDIWYKLAPMVGVDAQSSWMNGEWGLELRYLDDEFTALTHLKRIRNKASPRRKALNTAGDEEPQNPPKGVTIN